jgi:hypothetical protein
MQFLAWLETSGIGVWIRESLWGYPTVLSCHAVGMAIVVGIVSMIDFRVLGFARAIPIASFDRLFTFAWAGFALNLASGVLLFIGDAQRFAVHPTFLTKIVLIILGGIFAWLLLKALHEAPAEGAATGKAKTIAVLSLLCWSGAVIAGRLIAYLG